MEASDVLEAIGDLVAQIKVYSSKLPAVVHLSVMPGGLKPTPEAVEPMRRRCLGFDNKSEPRPTDR